MGEEGINNIHGVKTCLTLDLPTLLKLMYVLGQLMFCRRELLFSLQFDFGVNRAFQKPTKAGYPKTARYKSNQPLLHDFCSLNPTSNIPYCRQGRLLFNPGWLWPSSSFLKNQEMRMKAPAMELALISSDWPALRKKDEVVFKDKAELLSYVDDVR